MLRRGLILMFLILAGYAAPAQAAAHYQGIYVVIDPYQEAQVLNLASAAQISCKTVQQVVTSPFCKTANGTPANGILLRFPWCDFQLYHVNNALNQPSPSCHYTTGFSSGVSSAGVEQPWGDKVSPCSGTYDTCSGHVHSVLGTALGYIAKINTMRAQGGLAPLLLSIGMNAGIGTPEAVLDSVGYFDVASTTDATLTPSSFQCYRLPVAWKTQFVTDYEQAFGQMMAYIKTQFTQSPNIALVKVAGINATDLEIQVPGAATFYAAPSDPGPGGPGPLLNCSQTLSGAQVWFNAYNQNPLAGLNFSQANETAFGNIVGYEWATIANEGLSNVALSLATTDGAAYAAVDCGANGASSCAIATPLSGNYSVYYFNLYAADLFNGGLAYQAASTSYKSIRNASFTLAPSQLAVDSTSLSPSPYVSVNDLPCNLNNKVRADAPVFSLDGNSVTFMGVGSVISYQTSTNSGGLCATGQYKTAMQNGLNNGALFLEVETDAAFNDIALCSPYLAPTLTAILAKSTPTTCFY